MNDPDRTQEEPAGDADGGGAVATEPTRAPSPTRRYASAGTELRLFQPKLRIDGVPCTVERPQSTESEVASGVHQRVEVRLRGDDGKGRPIVGVSVFDPLTADERAAIVAKHPGVAVMWAEFSSEG